MADPKDVGHSVAGISDPSFHGVDLYSNVPNLASKVLVLGRKCQEFRCQTTPFVGLNICGYHKAPVIVENVERFTTNFSAGQGEIYVSTLLLNAVHV